MSIDLAHQFAVSCLFAKMPGLEMAPSSLMHDGVKFVNDQTELVFQIWKRGYERKAVRDELSEIIDTGQLTGKMVDVTRVEDPEPRYVFDKAFPGEDRTPIDTDQLVNLLNQWQTDGFIPKRLGD